MIGQPPAAACRKLRTSSSGPPWEPCRGASLCVATECHWHSVHNRDSDGDFAPARCWLLPNQPFFWKSIIFIIEKHPQRQCCGIRPSSSTDAEPAPFSHWQLELASTPARVAKWKRSSVGEVPATGSDQRAIASKSLALQSSEDGRAELRS